jgi:inner membrane protein
LLLRGSEPIRLSVGLVAGVLVLDSLWALVAGSPGSFAYAFVDLPAHAAVCTVALLALAGTQRPGLSKAFVIAALIASVAIDLDHIPGYLGSHLLGGNLPRPDTHGLLPIVVLIGIGAVVPNGRLRPIALGIAFGLSAHLVRDLATGPGVPLAWPVAGGTATIPYAVFAGSLLLAAAAPIVARSRSSARWRLRAGFGAALVLGLAVAMTFLPARAAEAASKAPISLGAYVKGADRDPALIEAYAQEVGRNPLIVSIYKNWGDSIFESEQLTGIWERGAVPMITWEPWGESEAGIPLGDRGRPVRPLHRS